MARHELVLLPGLLCDEAAWAGPRAALASRADTFVPEYKNQDSIGGMARKVLDAVPYRTFSLAGHSMGGRVALEVARLAPERVQRLALLDTGYQPIAGGNAGNIERNKRLALLAIAQTRGMRAMGTVWAAGMVHSQRLETALFEEILAMIARFTPGQFSGQINALLARPDATPVLQALACPTVLVCGRQDAWSPLARHEAMLQLLPARVGSLRVVEDSGHMTVMEQPQAVAGILAQWLESAPHA